MPLIGCRLLSVPLAAALVALIAATPARVPAQTGGASGRLLAMFDFEDTDDAGLPIGASYPMPVGWYPIGRDPLESDPNFLEQPLHAQLAQQPGFPTYTEVGFAGDHAASGDYSLRLGLDGGSAGAYVRTGILPAVPESTYLITSRARTAGLDQAAAALAACYVDDEGRRLPGSLRTSDPIATAGAWRDVSVQLDQAPPGSAWICVELLLLQPGQQRALGIRDAQPVGGIELQDVDAAAWFDDVGVWQLPYVAVTTQNPANVVRAPDRPELAVNVRDLTGQRLRARVTVYDERRQPVDAVERGVGDGVPSRWTWTPDLPGLGWYLVDLEVFDDRSAPAAGGDPTPVARTLSALLWTPAEAASPPPGLERYTVLAHELLQEHEPILPVMLRGVGATAVTLPAWHADTTSAGLSTQQDRLARTLESLIVAGVRPALDFTPLPGELAALIEGDRRDALTALLGDAAAWDRFVVPVLVRQGQAVDAWQVLAADRQSLGDRALLSQLAGLLDRVESYAPSPTVVSPWSVHRDPPASLPDRVRLLIDVPVAVQADRLPEQLEPWRPMGDRVRALLRSHSARDVAQERRIAELVLRMLRLREAGIAGAAIESPWTPGPHREPTLLPDPLLGAFTGAARRLVNRNVVATLPTPEGLEAVILEGPNGEGSLVAWNRAAPPDAELSMYLGRRPLLMDVWGNAAEIPLHDGKHRVRPRVIPRFIERIDLQLALFRAGFTLDDAFIVSEQTEHIRLLTLINPWPRTITGSLRFTGPDTWDVQPLRHNFSIPAGGQVRLPITMTFPIHEVAGLKSLAAEVDFVADRRYRVDLHTPLELGLPDIEFDASLALEPPRDQPAGPVHDALVTCLITNTGDGPRSLYVFANLFDHPRQERVVARLEPGQTIVRRFRFPAARDELLDYPLRCGIRETDGPAILNQRLDLGDAR